MAIRVYELSKKLGITNKELLEILKEHGFALSTVAAVPAEAEAIAEKVVAQRNGITVQQAPVEEKPEEKKAPLAKPVEKPAAPQPSIVRSEPPRPAKPVVQPVRLELVVEPMTVGEFAQKVRKPVSEVIITLLKQGVAATINQVLTEKTVAQLAQIYDIGVIQKAPLKAKEEKAAEVAVEGTWVERLPVVVVIGHVDHGKTTLLDFIRKTRVAAKEKGGITQHLGAYEVKTPQGNVVFLDTPGHEAFSLMRARGIKVADIAILVVAADDGVMPQTIEAIKRAKAAEVPIVVAINKIDKASPAQIETVKRQLAQYDLVPEEWGGQTICMPISAKLGQGIDKLLEVLVLQAQVMELKANISLPARGYVLESKVEKGRGPVATVICLHGILRTGDYFSAGSTWGKVNSLVDSYGKRVTEIAPSLPALVSGFSELPQAGDLFEVTTHEAVKKGVSVAPPRPEAVKRAMGENEINLIIKADNASSREALVAKLSHMHSEHRKVTVVYAGVGDISESDIMLAGDTGSLIYGFHVKVQPHAQDSIHKKGVVIKSFDIIYKLFEDVERILLEGKPIKMISKKIGEASVLKVFDIKELRNSCRSPREVWSFYSRWQGTHLAWQTKSRRRLY